MVFCVCVLFFWSYCGCEGWFFHGICVKNDPKNVKEKRRQTIRIVPEKKINDGKMSRMAVRGSGFGFVGSKAIECGEDFWSKVWNLAPPQGVWILGSEPIEGEY